MEKRRKSERRTAKGPGRKLAEKLYENRRAPPSKYDQMTFFDPTTRQVRHADGSTVDTHTGPGHVATALPSVGSLDNLPKQLLGADALYACEPSNEQSVKMLAAAAGCTIMELEGRRRGVSTMAGLPLRCPPQLPQGRRWCWRCPHWKLDLQATPF